jgi:hypothetical protein
MLKDSDIRGENPVDVLKENSNFMQISVPSVMGKKTANYGFINVHTGCLIAPTIETPTMFSNHYVYTGRVAVLWSHVQRDGYAFEFSQADTVEFLKKINI